jgi:hypothetical protein
MRQGGEAQAPGIAHIGREISAWDLAEGGNQLQQPTIGTRLEQYPVPLVFEIKAARDVSAGLLESPVHLAEAVEPVRGGGWREAEGQGLQRAQDVAHLPKLGGLQGTHPEPAPHGGIQHALAGEIEEGLADGGSADAQLGGEVAVADARAGRKIAAVDAVEDLATDLVSQRGTGDH